MIQQGLTRREMLERGIAVMGAGGLALAGLTGAAWPGDKAAAAMETILGSADKSLEMAESMSAALEEQSRATRHLHNVTASM